MILKGYQQGGPDMNEREVELIDTLRVLWWGRWVVLASVLIAVGFSVLHLVLRPTTYSGSMQLLVREVLTATMMGERSATAAVEAAIRSAVNDVEKTRPGTTAQISGFRIVLSRVGAESPETLLEALLHAETRLRSEIQLAITIELEHLTAQMRLQNEGMIAQRALLAQVIDDTQPVSEAMAMQIARLETEIAATHVRMKMIDDADPESLLAVTVVDPPTAEADARRRGTMVGVAGFLGLLSGTLLAFFLHYLRQVRDRERVHARGVDRQA